MKKHKYTVISLIAVGLFVIGSMAATNTILKYRETKILTERGKMDVDSPVREWNAGGGNDENPVDGDNDRKEDTLTMKQIKEAVTSWNNRAKVTLHERVEGQISMEEAIENGRQWLKAMDIDMEEDKSSFSVHAELGVGEQKINADGQRKAYFSFWTVTYANQSINAVLYLNAVTGMVWGAELKLYEKMPQKMPDDSLKTFLFQTGLQVTETDMMENGDEEIFSKIAIKGSGLYVQENVYTMVDHSKNMIDYVVYHLLAEQE